ncbi:hypothetical protein M440DRAFT_1388273 [Trichoderma longibrachiatum ATCC 18648]|uniref:Xylanolytic transcriptional activator regulatory domain-containing protein n=1 Tax=Trichoderma longibrachiatum ATCC 18648 TaxID=983965 RepID=A0A2T4CK69_TRILO|nr:hypothetical protein M440DRAFT_1388273 [Trichoderma longibrachiatum ATCC 18648]
MPHGLKQAWLTSILMEKMHYDDRASNPLSKNTSTSQTRRDYSLQRSQTYDKVFRDTGYQGHFWWYEYYYWYLDTWVARYAGLRSLVTWPNGLPSSQTYLLWRISTSTQQRSDAIARLPLCYSLENHLRKQHSLFDAEQLDLFASLGTTTATTAAHPSDDRTTLEAFLELNDTFCGSAPAHSAGDSFPNTSAGAFSDVSTAVSGHLSTQSDDHTSWTSTNSLFDPEQSSSSNDTGHSQFADCWEEAITKCKRLQFILHGLRSSNGPITLQPRDEPLRPLIERFVELEHQARPSAPAVTPNWAVGPDLSIHAVRRLLPPQRTCDRLLDAYFTTFESVLRILHIPDFRHDYRQFWGGSPSHCPPDLEQAFLCKFVICIALGAFVCPSLDAAVVGVVEQQRQEGSNLREQAKEWVAYGKQWLAREMMTGSQADTSTAQVVCLLALSRHTGPINAASTSSLWSPGDHDLTRVAMQMGLHRDPTILRSDMPAREVELRRRLWATMLELSLQLSLDHGLPAPISPESYDCAPPSEFTDDEATSADADPALSASLTSFFVDYGLPRTNPLVILARTQRLRLRILHLVHSPGASKAYEGTHQLSAELRAVYCAEIQRFLSFQKKPSVFQLKLLDAFTLPFVLAPHAKFAASATTNPAYYFSRRVRMEVSMLLLASQLPGPTAPDNGLGAVIPDADSMTLLATSTTISTGASATSTTSDALTALRIYCQGHLATLQWHAILALCLDMISELEDSFFPAVNGASWLQLQETIQAYITVLEQRVRNSAGANSAREFLFCSCAEAYIGAMMRGDTEIDQIIASAGYSALTLCCEIMEQGFQQRRAVV